MAAPLPDKLPRWAQLTTWAATTWYAVGDRAVNDAPQKIYECTTQGTSAGAGGPTGSGGVIADGSVVWTFIANLAAAAWLSSHAYSVGARVTNGGNLYVCTTAGTSAGAGGPTTTDPDITDGTVHWMFVSSAMALVVEPPESMKDIGWIRGQKPPATYFNWILWKSWQWLRYLQDLGDQALTFTAGITITQSSSDVGALDVTGNGNGMGLNATGGSNAVGVVGNGGGNSKQGVAGIGAGPNGTGVTGDGVGVGTGVYGTGGSGGGIGVRGLGQGGAAGVLGAGNGTAPGGTFTGGATGVGVRATGGTGQPDVEAAQGQIRIDTANGLGTAVAVGDIWKNTTLIGQGYVTNTGMLSGVGVTGITDTSAGAGTAYQITVGAAPSAKYVVVCQAFADRRLIYVTAQSIAGKTFDVKLRDDTGVAQAFDFMFLVFGF